MKLIPNICTQCSATLTISSEQKFAKCEHCGSQFVLEWDDRSKPTLTGFETVLAKVVDDTKFLAADRRLGYLRKDISEARDVLAACEDALQVSQKNFDKVSRIGRKRIEDIQTYMWIAGGVGFLFFVLVFTTNEWWFCLVLPAFLSIGALYLYRKYYVEYENAAERRKAQSAIDIEKQSISKANLRLNDFLFGKRIVQKNCRKIPV